MVPGECGGFQQRLDTVSGGGNRVSKDKEGSVHGNSWAMRMKEESWKGCYGQISRAPGVQRRAFSLFFRQRGTTEGSGEQMHGRVS